MMGIFSALMALVLGVSTHANTGLAKAKLHLDARGIVTANEVISPTPTVSVSPTPTTEVTPTVAATITVSPTVTPKPTKGEGIGQEKIEAFNSKSGKDMPKPLPVVAVDHSVALEPKVTTSPTGTVAPTTTESNTNTAPGKSGEHTDKSQRGNH